MALGWMKKGYLPTKRIGKYTLINLAQLKVELLESDINQTKPNQTKPNQTDCGKCPEPIC